MYRQLYYGGGEGIASLDAGAPSIKYTGDIRPQMAMSAPDPMDALNDLAMELFGKSLDQLTPRERDALDEYNSSQMAQGGIMYLRQQYGLGSIVKSVGKAVKGAVGAVKDVASSDLGKAALSAAAIYYGGPMLSSAFKGPSTWTGIGNALKASSLGKAFTGSNLLKTGTLLAGSALMTNLFGSPQKAAQLYSERPEAVSMYLGEYYKQVNPKKEGQSDEDYAKEVSDFVSRNTAEYRTSDTFAIGGRAMKAYGDKAEMASEVEGLPFRQNQAGIGEVDLRETGGFIPPVGIKEKADDIPAMLSNNEFVFTADAVRGMGNGDVEVGAQRMYDMMKKLENGGRV